MGALIDCERCRAVVVRWDRDPALQEFLARRGHPATKADWNAQLRQIVEHWEELKTTFAGRILEVVEKVVTLRASRTFWTGMVLYKHHTNGWA